MKAYEIIINGRVQGVGFRYSALEKARALNIRGWIRNGSGGIVTAFAWGEENELQAFVAWMRLGPPGAQVERLELSERVVPEDAPDYFQIL